MQRGLGTVPGVGRQRHSKPVMRMIIRWTPVATDVTAVIVLAYGLFFRRYYRRDLLLAYVS